VQAIWRPLVLALLISAATALPHSALAQVEDQEAAVINIVDGDTIDAQLADGSTHRVCIIGIDAPETVAPGRLVECWGPEASA